MSNQTLGTLGRWLLSRNPLTINKSGAAGRSIREGRDEASFHAEPFVRCYRVHRRGSEVLAMVGLRRLRPTTTSLGLLARCAPTYIQSAQIGTNFGRAQLLAVC